MKEEEEEEEKFEIRRGNNLKFIAPHFHRSVLNVEGRTGRFKKMRDLNLRKFFRFFGGVPQFLKDKNS